MDDEFWNELVRGAESYEFGDAMTMNSSFNTLDEMEVGSNPTVSSFDSPRWNNELERQVTKNTDFIPFYLTNYFVSAPNSSSYFTSSNDSSPFHSYTSQDSPTQESDSSPRVHPSILHRNSPVQETDRYELCCPYYVVSMENKLTSPSSTFPSRFECHECGKKFSTKNNCQRHRRNVHGSNSSSPYIESLPTNIQGVKRSANLIPVQQKCDCPHLTCKRKGKMGFSRPDNLIQHRRNVHNENIPKRQRQS